MKLLTIQIRKYVRTVWTCLSIVRRCKPIRHADNRLISNVSSEPITPDSVPDIKNNFIAVRLSVLWLSEVIVALDGTQIKVTFFFSMTFTIINWVFLEGLVLLN